MKAQTIVMKDGTKHVIPMKNNYDNFALENQMGIMVWKQNNNIFPHSEVSCILETEVEEPIKKEEVAF